MQKPEEAVSCRTRRPWKRILAVIAAAAFVIAGTLATRGELGSGSASSAAKRAASINRSYLSDADGSAVLYSTETADAGYEASAAAGSTAAEQAKKIIRTASVSLAARDYDTALSAIRRLCTEAGGWVSWSSETVSSYSGLRTANLTLRVPADKLDSFLQGTDGVARVTARSESMTDVSDSYYDTQARLNTQTALRERLMSLMTDAASLADLLALETQLAETQYTIDSLTASLQSTDSQVNNATVDITLREESAADEAKSSPSLGQRIAGAMDTGWSALVEFLQDAVVFLAAALPFIGIAAAAFLAVVLLRRRRGKKPKA